MEHIGEALHNLSRGTNIPGQRIIEPEPELTLEEEREELRKSLGVASLGNTFENFNPVAGTEKALAAFKALATGKTKWRMLLCYGGVGNGKTHLCEATAIALHRRGLFCRVLTMVKMVEMLKECFGPDPFISSAELKHNYCTAERLIIDDVGMGGSGTEWAFGQLEGIIVERHREGLFTILSSNLDIKPDPKHPDISFIPERIVSRFKDPDKGRVILNSGDDYRRQK